MEQINYDIKFANLVRLNTLLYHIHRECIHQLATEDYKLFYSVFKQGDVFYEMANIEQSYKLTATYNDPQRTKAKLGDYMLKTQQCINHVKLYCSVEFLKPLQSLEFKVLLMLRDINKPTDTIEAMPHTLIQSLTEKIEL